MLQGFR